ncbi:rhamnosyltransferase [Pedobacter sp.]|uniref:rhamnosyltransferase n=1 Tax=Pedobacter sp. TaxID=1411316 RepID=UPI003BAD5F1E
MKVFAIIVAYNPKIYQLINLCNQLENSGLSVVLVENTEQNSLKETITLTNTFVIELNSNQGIARAQNIGINYAVTNGADIIVFFDQDSTIKEDFISNLLSPIVDGSPMVVAPVFYDEQQGFEYPSFKFNRFNLLDKVYSENRLAPYEVDVIISSGSAATKAVFLKVGLMDEDFFIDFVDIEWTIRCKKNDVPIYIVPQATMIHAIGEKSINLGVIRGFIHSSLRSYYKLRNPFLLLRKAHVPTNLALKEILAAMVHQFVFMFYVANKLEYFRSYIIAIRDGLKGKKGKKANL